MQAGGNLKDAIQVNRRSERKNKKRCEIEVVFLAGGISEEKTKTLHAHDVYFGYLHFFFCVQNESARGLLLENK